jgi:hypothetical protein
MPIIAPVSISMVNDYQVPKTSCIPARENHGSTIGRKNGLALISAYINPKMAAPIRLGYQDWRNGPGKIATTNINQRPRIITRRFPTFTWEYRGTWLLPHDLFFSSRNNDLTPCKQFGRHRSPKIVSNKIDNLIDRNTI